MTKRPIGAELIVVWDFNIDMEGTDRLGRDEDIATAIEPAGMEDLVRNFLP